MDGDPEERLRERMRRLKLRFVTRMLLALAGWVIVGAIAARRAGWPQSFGFHCEGRRCFFRALLESPKLLERGGFYPDALFAIEWLMPLSLVAIILLHNRAVRALQREDAAARRQRDPWAAAEDRHD
jgi:hypothetical protein